MGIHIRKNDEGILEAKIIGKTEWHLLNQTRRLANEQEFEIKHFVSIDKWMAIYAFRGISMSMLNNHPLTTNQFGTRGGGGRSMSKPIYYPGNVFLVFPNMAQVNVCKLLDSQGCSLAGSNIHGTESAPQRSDNGNLCLASRMSPLEMTPVDALIYNRANNDLTWKGPNLQGSWRPITPGSRTRIFHTDIWPAWTPTIFQIPQEILDATDNW